MSGGFLSKPIDSTVLRRLDVERVTTAILALWCLMPLAVAVACVAYGMTDGVTLTWESKGVSPGFFKAQSVYRVLFYTLGCVTVLCAIARIGACWRKIKTLDSVKRHPWVYLFAALLAWSAVSAFLADSPLVALSGSQYNYDGLLGYAIYAGVFCCAPSLRSERSKTLLLALFVGVVDVLGVVLLLEGLRVYPVYAFFSSAWATVFLNMNHFGYVLCMAILCAAGLFLYGGSLRMRAFCLCSFGFLLLALLINDTFGCYIATIVGLVAVAAIWFSSGRRRARGLIVLCLVFIALTAVGLSGVLLPMRGSDLGTDFTQLFKDILNISQDNDDAPRAGSGRMRCWTVALQMIPERPFFGYGPEGLLGEYAHITGVTRPHNEVIQYAVFLGIPGLLLYLSALVALAVRQFPNSKRLSPLTLVSMGVVIGYFASSLFGITAFNTVPYYWMVLGFAACPPDPGDSFFELPGEPSGAVRASRGSRALRIAAAVAVVVIVGAVVYLGLRKSVEGSKESSDIAMQDAAYASARKRLASGSVEAATEFYYDAATFNVVEPSDYIPTTCGDGTTADGKATTGSVYYFEDTRGYDTHVDYTDKILRIVVDPAAEEAHQIEMEWVVAPT